MTQTQTRPLDFALATDDELTSDVVLDCAADVGNARCVFLLRLGEQTREIRMPAVRTLHGASSFDLFVRRGQKAGSWQTLGADEHVIERDGVERFLGKLAIDQDRLAVSSGRGSDRRYSDGTITDFVLASAAAALPNASRISLRLATMVPISLWPLVHENVEQSLRGTFRYPYNGREVTTKIVQVFVRREAEVAYAARPEWLSGRVLVLDGGGRTFNVALFADGVYKAGATIDNMGVEAALDAVDKDLLRGGMAPLMLVERAELLDALRADRPYDITRIGGKQRMNWVARKHFDAAAAALVQELHAKVKVEAAEHALFIGGAAYPEFFGAKVRELLPVVELVREPELQNVYGALASLGVQVKKGRRK